MVAKKASARAAKPVSKATQQMLDAMNEDADKPVSEDKLEKIRDEIKRLRELEVDNASMAERTKLNSEQINLLKNKTLVDLFDAAGIDKLGVVADGNLPAYDIELGDYYHANIPKDREAGAYAWLKKTNNEDMIKTTFTIEFGLGEGDECKQLEKLLDDNEVAYSKKEGVPWNTLTAFVKEQYAKGKPLTEKVKGLLGATVGRVAKVVKEKKPRASKSKGK